MLKLVYSIIILALFVTILSVLLKWAVSAIIFGLVLFIAISVLAALFN